MMSVKSFVSCVAISAAFTVTPTSFVWASSVCSDVFDLSQRVTQELVDLRLQADSAGDISSAKLLYAAFKEKYHEAQKLHVNLDSFTIIYSQRKILLSESSMTDTKSLGHVKHSEARELVPWELLAETASTDETRLVDVTPDGSRLIVEKRPGELEIQGQTKNANTPIFNFNGTLKGVQLSPDLRFAVLSGIGRNGGMSRSVLVDLTSKLVVFEGDLSRPVFSSDGKKTVISKRGQIVILDLPSLTENRFPFDPKGSKLRFSSDGKKLIFAGQEGLEILDLKSGRKKSDARARDGRYVFGISDDASLFCGMGTELYGRAIVKADGSRIELPLPNEQEIVGDAVFSPDQQRLAIGASNEVWVFDTATGQLTGTIPLSGSLTKFELGGDGSSILINTKSTGSKPNVIHQLVYRWMPRA